MARIKEKTSFAAGVRAGVEVYDIVKEGSFRALRRRRLRRRDGLEEDIV